MGSLAAEVVTADGALVACDAEREPDLFWALRGAGGCRVGVVTSLTLRTLPAPVTTTLHARWAWADGPAVLEAWQHWAPDAPDDLAASLLVTAGPDPAAAPGGARLRGVPRRPRRGCVARSARSPLRRRIRRPARASVPRREAPASPSTGRARRPRTTRTPGRGRSSSGARCPRTWARPARPSRVGADAGRVARPRSHTLGRRVQPRPGDATAFAHRAERFLVKHEVTVDAGAGDDARAWLDRSWDIVHPWGSGRVYPNFPDPALDDHAAATTARTSSVCAARRRCTTRTASSAT